MQKTPEMRTCKNRALTALVSVIYLIFELIFGNNIFQFFLLDSLCVAAYMSNLQFLKSN